MRTLEVILLTVALIIPCIPKLQIVEGVTMYPYEILAILMIPYFAKSIKFELQKTLVLIWLIILGSTIISCMAVFTSGGLMRCLKELLYIPLMYLAYRNRWVSLKLMVYIFITAFILNILFLIANGFLFGELDIWNRDSLSSGFSNKIISLKSFSVIVNPNTGGAHGIWLGYSNLCVFISYIAAKRKEISRPLFYMTFLFGLINVMMSVSREGFIVFFCLMVGIISDVFYGKRVNHIFRKQIVTLCFFVVLVLLALIAYFSDDIAIIQKIIYTHDSILSSGEEGNISLRIGAWIVYLISVVYNPIYLIFGYGFNMENYVQAIKPITAHYNGLYVTIPESFFVEMAMYGGVFALIFGVEFWRKLLMLSFNLKHLYVKRPFIWLLVGLLIGNIFSGATIICDLLYSQLLIVLGILVREEEQMKLIYLQKKLRKIYGYSS